MIERFRALKISSLNHSATPNIKISSISGDNVYFLNKVAILRGDFDKLNALSIRIVCVSFGRNISKVYYFSLSSHSQLHPGVPNGI